MRRPEHHSPQSRSLLRRATAFCLILLSARIIGAQTPDQTFVSGKDVVLYPPDHGVSSFRFLPAGLLAPFDRSLVLSAAPGETRVYLLQTGSESSIKSGEAPIIAYVVDKRRPSAPRAEPDTGLYSAAVEPELKSDEGADIFWGIVGPAGIAESFLPYGPESRPRFAIPARGSATYTLLAYSVSSSGTRSYPSRFVYRMAEAGLPAAAPRRDAAALTADPSLPKPEIETSRGYAEIRMSLPPGASLLVDFSDEAVPSALDDFERIEAEGGFVKLRVPCAYAWSDDVGFYYGIFKDGVASYNPQPIVLHLSYPADDRPPPAAPPAPVLAADPAGRGAFVAFPAYDGDIYVSLGSGKSALYASPIALSGESTSARVTWYGEDTAGRRSSSHSITLALPENVADIDLVGVAEGAAISGDVLLKPVLTASAENASASKTSIRYELRLDGSIPPEPGSGSPILGESLALTCPPGEERAVVLRYRRLSGEAASEGRILRFTLDRKPPEVPLVSELPSTYTDRPLSLELLPGKGGKDVFASVSADGAPAAFLPVTAPIVLTGSDAGPVTYAIRAYDVDAAGNRSQEMKALSIIVDKSSVYAAEDGSDKGDGSPDRPFRSLDAAVAAVMRGGKRSVNIRGAIEMRTVALFSTEVNLVGGFGKSWVKEGSTRAIVKVSLPQGQSAFIQRGGSLSLRRVELRAEGAGSGALIELSGASLSVADSILAAGSDGDFILVSAVQSKISLTSSRVQALRAMSFTAFSTDRSEIALSGSSLSAAKGVRIFGAFDMDGGSLSIRESLFECRSDLGLNLMNLRSASLLMDRSLVNVEGGSGYLRIGSFKAVSGEIKNSKVILSWKGPGALFEIAEGGPSFRHDTIKADTTKGPLRFFDVRDALPQIWNSILIGSGPGTELLRSASMPGAGVLVADCVWGFERLLTGALETSDLQSLNDLNSASALYSTKPLISESPDGIFAAPLKSLAPLRKGSACVGAALALGKGYEVDFGGHPRPALGKDAPDIGADELSD